MPLEEEKLGTTKYHPFTQLMMADVNQCMPVEDLHSFVDESIQPVMSSPRDIVQTGA